MITGFALIGDAGNHADSGAAEAKRLLGSVPPYAAKIIDDSQQRCGTEDHIGSRLRYRNICGASRVVSAEPVIADG